MNPAHHFIDNTTSNDNLKNSENSSSFVFDEGYVLFFHSNDSLF